MLTTLAVTTAPVGEPVTVAQARQHCRIDHASDDDLLAIYIQTARIMAEGYLSRALLTQTLLWTVRPQDQLHPGRSSLGGPLELPRAPVSQFVSLTVLDDRGNTTTVPAAILPIVPPAAFTGYVVDLSLEPARLRIGRDTPLIDGRTLRHARLENIQAAFVAGYGTPDTVPAPICNAILMIVASLYENRGDAGGELPRTAELLLDRYRMSWLG
jgi:uncharacterized phiE125 gp8 family phage protein